jgi:citrate synthase
MVNVDQRVLRDQPSGIDDADWVSAEAACALLSVKRETLYAYASRGLVGTRAVAGSRKRLYERADLEKLRARHDARAGHGAVAASALRFGEPVLDSAITRVDSEGPHYRGHAACALASEGISYERVTELLLTGVLPKGETRFAPPKLPSLASIRSLLPRDAEPVDAVVASLTALALKDPRRYAMDDDVLLERARETLMALTALVGLAASPQHVERAQAERTLAARLSVALGGPSRGPSVGAVEQALILSADHELNPSSFACRVAASAGADLHACYLAALGPMLGSGHGGATARVEALVAETVRPEHAASVVRDRMRRGEGIPGFGHPLYPEGDPRAVPLFALARPLAERRVAARTLLSLVDAAQLVGIAPPNIDTAIVALSLGLGLTRGAAWVIFLIGRVAGWTAHLVEQRAARFALRPRARYVGP